MFEQIYNKILCEVNEQLFHTSKQLNFLNSFNSLISEDYKIFPVPKKLLDDIELFTKQNIDKVLNNDNLLINKKYYFNQIQQNYVSDWCYYKQFNENVSLMLKENSKCNITVCLFNTEQQIQQILQLYPSNKITKEQIFNSNGCIYSYGNNKDFNACLSINVLCDFDNFRKNIQHKLIHWMQVALNSYTNKSYGLYNNKKFNFIGDQLLFLTNVTRIPSTEFKQMFNYMLCGTEFEAWVANTCEEFICSKLTIEQFKHIIENKNIFKLTYFNSNNNQREMFLFGEICYLSSLNDSNDDRYRYLTEALKNHCSH